MKLYTRRSVFSPTLPPIVVIVFFFFWGGGGGVGSVTQRNSRSVKKGKEENELPSFCCSTVYCTTDLRALVNAHTYADTRDVTDRAAAPECAQRRKKKKKKSSLRTHRALSFCLFLFFFFLRLPLFCFCLFVFSCGHIESLFPLLHLTLCIPHAPLPSAKRRREEKKKKERRESSQTRFYLPRSSYRLHTQTYARIHRCQQFSFFFFFTDAAVPFHS